MTVWPRRENFQGKSIPTAAGAVFLLIPLSLVLIRIAAAGVVTATDWITVASFGFIILALGLLGLLDDTVGGHQAKGFKGHLKALSKGKVTTGLIKAAGGGLAALLVAWYLWTPLIQWWEIPLNGLLIALGINTFNLLDLRPGRALKVFFASLVLLWIGSAGYWFWGSPVLWVFIVIALILFPFDLRGRLMLGDAGSNILGGVVGLMAVEALSLPARVIVLIIFLALNIISEKWSFTQIIGAITPLKWLDEAGRIH